MPFKALPFSSRELLRRYRKGATLEELAARCRVSRPVIQRRLSAIDPDFIEKRRKRLARSQTAQILKGLKEGKSAAEIGRGLGLTTTTIKCLIAEQPKLLKAQAQRRKKWQKSRVLAVIQVLEEHDPEVPSFEIIAREIGMQPSALVVWLRRNYPQVIEYVSKKPSRAQKGERKAKLAALRSEHPEYNMVQLAAAMEMNYGTLAGWLYRNPLHTFQEEEE